MASERSTVGRLGARDVLRRHTIHSLCLGNMTHSLLLKRAGELVSSGGGGGVGAGANSTEGLLHAADLDDVLREVASFDEARGVYELHATRYELLAGRQGASGVADPEVLSAIAHAPASYSAAGSQAFHTQQSHAVRYAALRAGRKGQRPTNQPFGFRSGRTFTTSPPTTRSGSSTTPGASVPGPPPSAEPARSDTGTRGRSGRGGKQRGRGHGRHA